MRLETGQRYWSSELQIEGRQMTGVSKSSNVRLTDLDCTSPLTGLYKRAGYVALSLAVYQYFMYTYSCTR